MLRGGYCFSFGFTSIASPEHLLNPKRIHPPRRIGHIPIPIDPTRQLHRVRRQITPNIRIVVAMPVVVQPAFRVEILALETQRIIDYSHIETGYFPVGTVVRRPDDFAVGACQFLGVPRWSSW